MKSAVNVEVNLNKKKKQEKAIIKLFDGASVGQLVRVAVVANEDSCCSTLTPKKNRRVHWFVSSFSCTVHAPICRSLPSLILLFVRFE